MRTTTILPGESLWHVAARTIAASSYQGQGALAAYVAAIVARNVLPREQPSPIGAIVDWTALPLGAVLELPT